MVSLEHRRTPTLRKRSQKNGAHLFQKTTMAASRSKLILYAFLLIASFQILNNTMSTTTLWSNDLSIHYNDNNDGRLDAIVTVAMCGFHAQEMVDALRTAGQWKGPIYVLTDSPEFYDSSSQQQQSRSSSSSSSFTPVNVRGNHPTFLTHPEFDQYKIGVQRFNPEIYSKWHKTQIFPFIPPQHNNILFLDADMLAQQPLHNGWLSSVAPLIADPTCELILNPERWYTSFPIIGKGNRTLSGNYNSGMMILKRKESQHVLKEWSRLLVSPPYVGRDQGKLTQAIEEDSTTTKTTTKVCWLPSHWIHVQNQADVVDRIWFRLRGKGTFLHLASAKNKGEWKSRRLQQKCNFTKLEYPHPKV